jgi:hypothetical protein
MNDEIKDFFANSELLDYLALRPLSHINGNWELIWDIEKEEYEREEDSFAGKLNDLILELARTTPPTKYHENEDKLAEYVKKHLNWSVNKVGNRWEGEDYQVILEQGGFHDINENELVKAATGRIQAALDRGQFHFDDMEESHRKILGGVLCIILYHRMD